ncbi:MAG: hypothetical protein RLZZ200_2524 [Pseudomonadota bacterium]
MNTIPHAPYIELDGIAKRFGEVTAVDGVSLGIRKGEIFCLLGASGCGKTTLLRILAGFEQPTAGRVLIDGQDMAGVPPYERPVNLMFQSYALFPHMTVEKNIAFGLEQEGLPKDEIRRRVADILDIVHLSEYGARRPHQLSGGQRQRVALARALVKRPKLLLLDEPLGALDRKLREHTQFELLNIQQQLGVTFVVVTHDQEEAMTLATRIGVMHRGRLVQVGAPREIYESPATRHVADFIGSVNLFDGVVASGGADHVGLLCEDLPVPVFVDQALGAPVGERVWVAIRPEKIRLSHEPQPGPENLARGTIQDIAYLGDITTYVVRLESGRGMKVTRANAARRGVDDFARGQAVHLGWDPSGPVVGRD